MKSDGRNVTVSPRARPGRDVRRGGEATPRGGVEPGGARAG
jgi:hypothetical protein